MAPTPGENRLTQQQKTGFVLLLVFGILTVTLGFLQMRNTIYAPFMASADKEEERTISSFYDDETRLQQIDTDQDGLNDYEELEFYGTSPYLPDTDSDGTDDKTELEEGTDPLCPEGQECGAGDAGLPPVDIDMITSPLADSIPTPADLLQRATAGLSTGTSTAIDLESILNDPDALRQILLNTGSITPEQLDGIDDEALLQLVQEISQGQDSLLEFD